jgi:hypothetical protein
MAEVTKTYVTLWYPGSFMSEDETVEVKTRDPKAIAKKYPRCFAFEFYDRVETEVTVGGEKKTVGSSPRNKSPKYFPSGKTFTVAEVKEKVPDSRILVSNMECNGWGTVVKTRCGNFQPFDKNCELV